MFQFTRFPLPALCVQTGVTLHDECRVSPFGYPRINAWSAAPRGFSQPPTSFIGIWRQGIHRWLFIAWDFFLHCLLDARARSAVLNAPMRSSARGRAGTRRRDGPRGKTSWLVGQRTAPSKRNSDARAGRPGPGGASSTRLEGSGGTGRRLPVIDVGVSPKFPKEMGLGQWTP